MPVLHVCRHVYHFLEPEQYYRLMSVLFRSLLERFWPAAGRRKALHRLTSHRTNSTPVHGGNSRLFGLRFGMLLYVPGPTTECT
jgi:hypothetical protein